LFNSPPNHGSNPCRSKLDVLDLVGYDDEDEDEEDADAVAVEDANRAVRRSVSSCLILFFFILST
jgi:hypothetical protein